MQPGGIPLTPVPNTGNCWLWGTKVTPQKSLPSATVSPPPAEQLCPQPEAGGGEHLEAISLPIRLSFPWELAEDGKKEQKGACGAAAGSPRGAAGVLWGALAVPCSRCYLRGGFAGATQGPPPPSFITFWSLGIRRRPHSRPGFCFLARCVVSGPSPGDMGTLRAQSPRPGQLK